MNNRNEVHPKNGLFCPVTKCNNQAHVHVEPYLFIDMCTLPLETYFLFIQKMSHAGFKPKTHAWTALHADVLPSELSRLDGREINIAYTFYSCNCVHTKPLYVQHLIGKQFKVTTLRMDSSVQMNTPCKN